jgi:hypothetical protein
MDEVGWTTASEMVCTYHPIENSNIFPEPFGVTEQFNPGLFHGFDLFVSEGLK